MLALRELFVNVCILIAVIFIGGQVFYKTGLRAAGSLMTQIASGIVNGVFGIILMIFSMPVAPGVILDYRNLAVMIGAVYAGWRSVLITGGVMAMYRMFNFGFSPASLEAGISIMLMTVGCAIIGKLRISNIKQWIYMFILTGLNFSVFIFLVLKDVFKIAQTLAYFWVGSAISSIIVYFLVQYLIKSNSTLNRLKEEATKDFLTGLDNVRSFDINFNSLLDKAKENDESIAFLAIDIDYFKKINDTYGHMAGDIVLKEFGRLMVSSVRDFDRVARVGGEEFAVILRDCSTQRSMEIAERIRKKAESSKFKLPCGNEISITISIGIAVYPSTVAEKDMLREKADEKLYEAKHTGRNRVCV